VNFEGEKLWWAIVETFENRGTTLEKIVAFGAGSDNRKVSAGSTGRQFVVSLKKPLAER